MKDIGYVCLGCRIRLLASATAQASRRVALSRQTRTQNHDRTQSRAFSSVTRQLPIHVQERGTSRAIHNGRSWRNVELAEGEEEKSPSIALFKSIVEAPSARHGKPATATKEEDPPTGLSQEAYYKLMKTAAKLHDIIQGEKQSIAPAFTYFAETLHPQLVEAGCVPAVVKDGACRDLMRGLFNEKAQDFASDALPTVTRISELTLELGILTPAAWGTLMIELLQHITTLSTQPADFATIEDYINAIDRRDDLLRDLVGAWKVFCGFVSFETNSPPPLGSEEYESAVKNQISGQDDLHQPLAKKDKVRIPFQELLRQSFAVPTPKGGMFRPSIAAFATYQLLEDSVNNKRTVREEAAPFFDMVHKLFKTTGFPGFKGMEPTLQAYPSLLKYLKWCTSKEGPKSQRPRRPNSGSRPSGDLFHSIHRKIGQAIRGRNLAALKKTWTEFWGEAAVPDADRIAELSNYPQVFDYFILAYMGMRQPGLAIDVWNRMEQIGVLPTIKTWNSMMLGCANSKNADGIKTVWRNLLASGMKLDTTIWTARISGLISSGDSESGLRALEEMVQIWNKSRLNTKGSNENEAIAVQPTIEPVNAALAGLLRLERGVAARNLLGWAASQGIQPDIVTFNILLRPLVRKRQMDKVDEIFKMMNASNVSADAATFTILFDGALSDLGSQSPEKQVELVTNIISQMEAAGVEVNMQMYAKMIYLFLQEGESSEAPVKAILAHIWNSGLELTSHIYTMLAEHYFSRSPPDSRPVTALIENRKLHTNRDIDRVFWERVIKGYCQTGETDRAHQIFDKVFASGTTITFSTLYELLLALINLGDRAAAEKLVVTARDIKEATGEGDASKKTRFWKHRFWHLVDQYGLLEEGLVEPFLKAQTQGTGKAE
ncbi:hypothetical protein QBC37DRAFT_203575 [Rhypophila decipiens]|uniref:Pentatricopeptide repeat-containing protein n=1 Tax=Rhypophila decipiens TaxID=261697 RepID=A0AAN7B8F9_9PEZI|nr:hypothetical protein QBC37DRAFT_203575 [Rhypophila decipiens]